MSKPQVEVQCLRNVSFEGCPAQLAEHAQQEPVFTEAQASRRVLCNHLVPNSAAIRPITKCLLQVTLLFPHAADDSIAEELLDWFTAAVCGKIGSCAGVQSEYGAVWHAPSTHYALREVCLLKGQFCAVFLTGLISDSQPISVNRSGPSGTN